MAGKVKESSSRQSGQAGNVEDLEISQKIQTLLNIPMPDKNDWKARTFDAKSSKSWVSFLPKKDLTEEEIQDLSYSAKSAPGITATKVEKLLEKHPTNTQLYMLLAVCCLGIIGEEKNRDKILSGLKTAILQALVPFANNKLSVYNTECFVGIYYKFLESLKKEQLRVSYIIKHDSKRKDVAQSLLHYSRVTDLLASSKEKNVAALKKIKSSFKKNRNANLTSTFGKKELNSAYTLVDKQQPDEDCGFATAGEILNLAFGLLNIFGKIPILEEAFLAIYKEIPDKKLAFKLRKESARSNLLMSKFKISMVEGDIQKIKKYIQDIYSLNLGLTKKLQGQALTKSFEADAFINVALVTETAKNYLDNAQYIEMIKNALECMKYLISRDQTKGNKYAESANKHSLKLTAILDEVNE